MLDPLGLSPLDPCSTERVDMGNELNEACHRNASVPTNGVSQKAVAALVKRLRNEIRRGPQDSPHLRRRRSDELKVRTTMKPTV